MSTFCEMAYTFTAPHNKKLKTLQAPLNQTFGINYFFYAHISTDRRLMCTGTNPDLIQHFFDEKMHFVWPFLVNTDQVKTGVYLYDSVQHSDFQTTMQLLEQKYQAKHSCLITKKDQTGCHMYGFAVPPSLRGYESLILNEKPLLEKFTHYFQQEMKVLLPKMKEQAIDLSAFDQMTLSTKESFDIPEIYLDESKKLHFLNTINDVIFTKREIDIIQLFLKGKSAREIAEELFLSKRTIEHYMEGLKNKLNCHSKSDLFERLNGSS